MLIPQQVNRRSGRKQGGSRPGLAELRSQLAKPSRISDGTRQRLLELAQRLTAVQALGDEYARVVALSPQASAAIGSTAVV